MMRPPSATKTIRGITRSYPRRTRSRSRAFDNTSEREHDAPYVFVLHGGEAGNRQTLLVIRLRSRQRNLAVPRPIVGLLMQRNVMHLRPNPLVTQRPHKTSPCRAQRAEVD